VLFAPEAIFFKLMDLIVTQYTHNEHHGNGTGQYALYTAQNIERRTVVFSNMDLCNPEMYCAVFSISELPI
jgi:hypothetical protein